MPLCVGFVNSFPWFTLSNALEASVKHIRTVAFFGPLQVHCFLECIYTHVCPMLWFKTKLIVTGRKIPIYSIKQDSFHNF